MGRERSIPVDIRSCVRISAAPLQAGLARKDRRRNVRGAFRILHPPGVERVAILDDVVTTGSTVSELTKVLLKKAGVKCVDIWAVARTP